MGYSPPGCKESDTTERLHSLTHSLCIIGSRFTHLIPTDSNPFLFMGLVLILVPFMALSTCQRHS